jgi:O-antigen/teichoic acid export membrane protein
MLSAGSWLPLVLFVLSVHTAQTHWWPTPWGPERTRVLLSLSVALGIAYAVIFAGMNCLLWKVRTREKIGNRFPSMFFSNGMLAVLSALIAAWSGSVLLGRPSPFLSGAVLAAWVVLTVGAGVLGFRLGRSTAKEKRRAPANAAVP